MTKAMAVAMAATIAVSIGTATAGARTPDRGRPTMAFHSEDGQIYYVSVANPALEHAVRGKATDRRSGIRQVRVLFKPCQQQEGTCTQSQAQSAANEEIILGGLDMACRNHRRSCTWSIPAPASPGFYKVIARSFDKADNRSPKRAIRITVI